MSEDNPFLGGVPAAYGTGGLDPKSSAIATKEAINEDKLDPGNPRKVLLDQARAELPTSVSAALERLNDPLTPLPQRLDVAAKLQSSLLPLLLAEALANSPNDARSVAVSRLQHGLKEVISVLKTKRDIENSDDLNPHSPKFSMVFGWFFDMVHQALVAQGVSEVAVNNVFAKLAMDLAGWEDKIEKRLRGVSGKALDSVTNPFIEEFLDAIPKTAPSAE